MSFTKLRYLENPGGFSKDKAALQLNVGSEFKGGSLLKGSVSNIDLNSFAVFEAFCFDEECFENQGIWTTALTSSKAKTVSGTVFYWIDCNLDSKGFGWLIDIYNVCFDTGQMSITESNIPVNLDLSFSSKLKTSPGLKILVLKKLSSTSCENIHYLYTNYNSSSFIKTEYSILSPLSTSHQSLNLEKLAISLLLLNTSKRKENNANQKIYYFSEDQDTYLATLIKKNIDKLLSLKDTKSYSKRKGSIPSNLTTYLTSNLLYEDSLYLNPKIYTFEAGCFDEDCFAVENTPLLNSREVNNRSVAWTLISLIQRESSLTTSEYIEDILELTDYLKNQIDSSTGLVYEGWTHDNLLLESKVINNFLFKTSVISLFALFYSYSFTKKESLLLDILNLSQKIEALFFNPTTLKFKDSLSEDSLESEESIIYGLLFSILIDRSDLIENLLDQINPFINQSFSNYFEVLLKDGNSNLISNGNGGYVYQTIEPFDSYYLKEHPYSQGLLNYGTYINLSDIPISDFLLFSLTNYLETQNYDIPNSLKKSTQNYNSFLETQFTLISQSLLISNNGLNNCLSTLKIRDLHRAKFFLNYVNKNLISRFPVGFGWLEEIVFLNTNFSKVIQVLSSVLIIWYISFYNKIKQLDIKSSIAGVKQTFQDTFNSLGVYYNIEELWKKITTFNSSESRIPAVSPSDSFLTGNKYTNNSILIKVFQPINNQLIKAIEDSKSIVSKIFFEENVQFEENLVLFNQSIGIIDFAEDSCLNFFHDNILILEDSECFITEGGSSIIL